MGESLPHRRATAVSLLLAARSGMSTSGDVEAIFHHPQHEYTKTLLAAVPTPDGLAVRPRHSEVPG